MCVIVRLCVFPFSTFRVLVSDLFMFACARAFVLLLVLHIGISGASDFSVFLSAVYIYIENGNNTLSFNGTHYCISNMGCQLSRSGILVLWSMIWRSQWLLLSEGWKRVPFKAFWKSQKPDRICRLVSSR